MNTSFRFLATLLLFAGFAVAHAQTPGDISGEWQIESSISLPEVARGAAADCFYSGSASLQDDDGALSGFAQLFLDSGSSECPAEMSADLVGSGSLDGDTFFFGAQLQGGLGVAELSGEIGPNLAGLGQTNVVQGPFAGASASWNIIRGSAAPIAVDDLTPVGLTLLLLLMLVFGYRLMQRHEPA